MPQFPRDEHGSAAVTFALTISVVLVGAGAALDYVDLTRKRTDLQVTADAASIAGAKALSLSSASGPAAQEAEAQNAATQVVREKAPTATPTVTASAANGTVSVKLAAQKPLFFGALLGLSKAPLSVAAEATYLPPASGCMIALSSDPGTGIDLVGSASITASKCGVRSNATGSASIKTQGAARIDARSICAAGGLQVKTSSLSKSFCQSAPDPYDTRSIKCGKSQNASCTSFSSSGNSGGSLPTTWPAGVCDQTFYSVPSNAKNAPALKPGVYCGGLDIRSDVVFSPGFYQIQDGPLSMTGGITVTGSGVSILLSGQGAVLDMQGSPQLTLSAMSSGPLAGIAISSVTPALPRLTSRLQGSPKVSLSGSVYLPNQTLDFQGNASMTLNGIADKLVAAAFDLQGSPDIVIKADESPTGTAAPSGIAMTR